MSADRELLELAAKAAGISVYWKRCAADLGDFEYQGWCGPFIEKSGLLLDNEWNPLTNDGDALRLAVALGINLTPYPIYNERARHSVIAKQRRSTDVMRQANPTEVIEVYGEDPAAAWRRAITRAAAEIGRTLP